MYWTKVQGLEGRTLKTLSRGKEFKIVSVTADQIYFYPLAGSGTHRWVTKRMLEHLLSLRLDKSELTPSRIGHEFPNDRNSAYMSAILHEIL